MTENRKVTSGTVEFWNWAKVGFVTFVGQMTSYITSLTHPILSVDFYSMESTNEERMELFLDIVKKSGIQLWRREIGKQTFNSVITKALEDYKYDEDEEKIRELNAEIEKLKARKQTLIGKRKRQKLEIPPTDVERNSSGVSDEFNDLTVSSQDANGEGSVLGVEH